METLTITPNGPAGQAGGDSGWQPRRYERCGMFKPAQIVLEDAVLDCVLLDISPAGAQVFLIARAELPDVVTLWLPGGEGRTVRRRWQQGSHIGFETVGAVAAPS